MKATVTKVKNPLESISRRSVLGVMGVGMTSILVGCNDDLSPLKLSLKSSATGEVTLASEVMLTATVGVGMADTIEFYESNPSGTDTLLGSVPVNLNAASQPIKYTTTDNGIHTYYSRATSMTGKDAPSNPVVVKVNIVAVQPPVLPTITLTASSTSVTAAGTITLTAAVTGGTISKVEFFEGAGLIGSANTAPYTFTPTAFTTANNGTHSYSAKVTDSNGNIVASKPDVVVTVGIPAALPTITLSASPTTVTAAGNVILTAAIAGGSFTQVEFFDGVTSLGMGVVAGTSYTKTIPFTTTSPAQTHNYTTKGTATDGRTVISAAVNVNVNIGNQAPTITLGSSSLSVTANGGITLTAVPTAKTGTIAKVEFFDAASPTPTVPVSTVTAAPWTFSPTFTAAKNGAHNYTAKATDSSGNSATSTPAVAVTVNIAATPPTIILATSSSNITAAGSITLSAAVTAGTGTISKVEFFEGTTLLGTSSSAASPYTFPIAFTNANNKIHTYTATVTASDGSIVTSAGVSVTVSIATVTTPPTIALSANPTSVTAAGSSTLTAAVTPGSGTITKVEFFEGATLLSTKTATPYTFVPAYTSANNGTHSYTAKVTASDGSTATSTIATVTVNITVTAGTRIALYTALAAAGSYVNFNHPTSGIKCILYRAATAQTGGVSNAGAYYVAYSRKCTHAGTIITQNPNTANPHVLTCQDHGATYNMDSNCAPINGVAPSALPSIVIKVGTDGIYI
jgi:Rieske Fe-S protein